MKYRIPSCRTARPANGSKLPDKGFVQVLARVDCVLNPTDSGNIPVFRLSYYLPPPVINWFTTTYKIIQYYCAQATYETDTMSVCRLSVFWDHTEILRD